MIARRSQQLGWLWVAFACLGLSPCRADLCVDVKLQTTPLIGHPAGPFSLDFQLNDGSGLGDANNTAMLSMFDFGTGDPAGVPTTSGGAMGDLNTGVTITDSSFLNEFTQEFTPGATLSFELMLTTQVDPGPQPDEFSFFILDSTGTPIPTLDPVAGRNAFLVIDITSANPSVQVYGSNPAIPPAGGGGGIDIPAAGIVNCPEPGTMTLMLSGASLLALSTYSRRSSRPISGRSGRTADAPSSASARTGIKGR